MTDIGLLLVLALATWRLAAALYMEAGPWLRLRLWAQNRGGFWQGQLSCFWCCTNWAAGLVWLVGRGLPVLIWHEPFYLDRLLEIPAMSAAALLLSHVGRVLWSEMKEGGG